MATTWGNYIPDINDRLNVPEDALYALSERTGEFETLLRTPVSARTPAMNAQLKTAHKELVAVMRDVKKRYFFSPPLADSDIISLGLKPKDDTPTPVGAPTARASGKITYRGAGRLELHIAPETDTADPAQAYYGCRIVYDTLDAGAPAPQRERDLHESRFTRRKKETFIFQPADSGKRIYISIRYENSKGQAGPWCPMISAVIP